MSTEETPTEETAEETQESSKELSELEFKIVRFSRLRENLLKSDKEWADEHTAKRVAILEEAGLLEQFRVMDAEVAQHRSQFKANMDPIVACLQVLMAYRKSQMDGEEFEGMETLEKVWQFEEQIFAGLTAKAEAEEAEEKEEKSEE